MSSEHENHGLNSNPLARFGAGLPTPPHAPTEGFTADELLAITEHLASFVPGPVQLDRDRLMFLAGQASTLASGKRQLPEAIDAPSSGAMYPAAATRNATEGAPYSARPAGTLGRWLWPAATATFATTALALLIALAVRPAPQPQPRIVYLDRIITIPPMETMAQPTTNIARSDAPGGERVVRMSAPDALQGNYLRTRDVALRLGLDALGISRGADNQVSPALTNRELLEGLTIPAASSTRQSPDRTSSM